PPGGRSSSCGWSLLPAGLRNAGHLARMSELAQADSAEAELAKHRMRSAAAPATGVGPHLELRLALLLDDERLLGHYCPSRRNGKPNASSSARPSALVRAVVTIEMSMPRVASTLS